MKKVKTYEEYDKHLLDKKDSKRDRRVETGLILQPARPDWAKDENLWGAERKYKRKIEGWEKLCIEAYFSGWIDYFDIITQGGKIDHTIYFEWNDEKKDEGEEKYVSLRIYLKPGPGQEPAPEPPAFVGTVPKPPPPPVS